jgi:GNAT superfamily N-acetyltransferase
VDYSIRKATRADRWRLERLIARSARALGARDYRPEQIEAALCGAFGVDMQLIDDGTYLVAEVDARIVGSGGWSHRRTLFGGDRHALRDPGELDPRVDAAKIRGFFIDPDFARRGIGRALLTRCETEAQTRGFRRFELMATITGVSFYQTLGYQPGDMIRYPEAANVVIEFVPMHKAIGT